ncbi:MAG: spore germination protein [Clostridia bacterium]|nr:spore germination protein [Clostridia bacterium]
MKSEKIGYAEAIALITIVMINKIILNTPKDIIAKTGPSSCLNIIFISVIAIIMAILISKLFKKFPGYDILDISKFLGGKTLKFIIGSAYILLLIILTASIIKSLSETLRTIYFPTSPILYITLFFIVSSILSNRYSLKVIAKANLIIAPIIFLSILIILVSSVKNFMPQRIFPILGYGANQTFFSGLTNLFSFSGLLYLLFLPPLLDKPEKIKRMSVIAIIISSLYLFLSVACLLLSLSFTMHSDESFSLYVLTRNLVYGRFIQRVDAIFILIWIIAILSYINIPISTCIYIFKKITKIYDTNSFNYSINLLILALCIIPVEYAIFTKVISQVVQNYFFVLFFAISLPILILANLKQIIINRFRKENNQNCAKIT